MRIWRCVAIGVAASVIAVAAGVRTIDAAWSMSVAPDVDLAVVTPTIPRPATVSCATSGGLIPSAILTWSHPGGGAPQPTAYVIRLLDNGVAIQIGSVSGSTTTFSISTTTLGGALTSILNLILLGQTRPVTVDSVYGTYESATSYQWRIQSAGLGGLGCSAISGFAAGGLSAPVDATTTTITVPSPPPTTATARTTTTVPTTTTTTVATTTTIAATTTLPATSTTVPATTVPPTTTTIPASTTTSTAPPTTVA